MKPIVIVLSAAVVAVFLWGCEVLRPLPDSEHAERVVEVAIFEGGYGIGWHTEMAEKFNELHKDDNVRIDLWGDPRTADAIKPRLLRGDPPDLILDERLPLWLLIAEGKLRPFTEALQKPAYGADESWGESFATGMLDMYTSGGEVYAVPAAYGAWGCWYDARMFREHGWEVPQTWSEFLELCESIKAAGIAPIALQGKYASFYAWNTYVALVQRVGGLAAINRINALEPDAFSHPDAVRAAAMLQDLARDYVQRGAMAMTHTESQLQFVSGNAALIFCGIWLENEMKENMPPRFEMRCFNIPPVQGGKGSPQLFHGQGMEFLFVPQDARYPEVAFDFARFLVSPANAPSMGNRIGVISPLANGTPRDSVTPALQSVLDMIDSSSGIFNVRVRDLFPEWRAQVLPSAINSLLRGESSPEEFCRELDEGVARAKSDPDNIIPPYQPYDPARYGEPL